MTNQIEALELYAEIYGEETAVIFEIASFKYAGHLIAVDLLQDGTEEAPNFFIHCRSVSAEAIKQGRVYPVEFAESEASFEIHQTFSGNGEAYELTRDEIRGIVAELIASEDFEAVN